MPVHDKTTISMQRPYHIHLCHCTIRPQYPHRDPTTLTYVLARLDPHIYTETPPHLPKLLQDKTPISTQRPYHIYLCTCTIRPHTMTFFLLFIEDLNQSCEDMFEVCSHFCVAVVVTWNWCWNKDLLFNRTSILVGKQNTSCWFEIVFFHWRFKWI